MKTYVLWNGGQLRPRSRALSGLAGMAGLSLLSALAAAPADAMVIANGFSCRHQIAHGSGRRARHIVLILREALEIRSRPAWAQ